MQFASPSQLERKHHKLVNTSLHEFFWALFDGGLTKVALMVVRALRPDISIMLYLYSVDQRDLEYPNVSTSVRSFRTGAIRIFPKE